jgi:hypothetical protein
MKKVQYSFPEFGFIFLVILLPLADGFIWRSETVWGLVSKIAGSMVIGFLIWLGMVFMICRSYDRKKRDEKTQA